MNLKSLVLAGIATAIFSSAAAASTITYATPGGSTQAGLPVDASATFVTSSGQITITLTNLEVNPTSVAQNLSDLFFTTSGGLTTSATLSSSSGVERTVAADGSFTNGSTVSTGWGLDASALGTIHLDDLNGFAGPLHTIIGAPDGSNVYSNANGGIAGNGPHNPFLGQTAFFTLLVPGVTADTQITSATFSFNTTSGNNVPGGCVGNNCAITVTPEPATLTLFGTGLAFLGTRLRRKKA